MIHHNDNSQRKPAMVISSILVAVTMLSTGVVFAQTNSEASDQSAPPPGPYRSYSGGHVMPAPRPSVMEQVIPAPVAVPDMPANSSDNQQSEQAAVEPEKTETGQQQQPDPAAQDRMQSNAQMQQGAPWAGYGNRPPVFQPRYNGRTLPPNQFAGRQQQWPAYPPQVYGRPRHPQQPPAWRPGPYQYSPQGQYWRGW